MLQLHRRERETEGRLPMSRNFVRNNWHAMATIAVMVMILRASIIMRRIPRITWMIVLVMTTTFRMVQGCENLARVGCQHTTLQADKNAEHREPCEQRFHQRRNPSFNSGRNQGICSFGSFGTVSLTEKPPPSGSVALVSPPQASMAVRTMARPSPLPPVSRLRERSMR